MSNSEARRALVPQKHGGALLAGGVPGNAGGPGAPPSVLRARLRGSFAERVAILEGIADDEEAVARDRIRAVAVLAAYGLGQARELNTETVRERLAATLEVIRSELPESDAVRVIGRLREVWAK